MDGSHADAAFFADNGVRFTVGDPGKYLGFTFGQVDRLE